MQVPRHWAEARRQQNAGGRQFTVRRWGWSDRDPADAERHAGARAEEALRRIVAGEKLPRVERKVPYNGADGMPIREEIVEQVGDAVVTRNLYGARCLNVPDVLIADVDFPSASGLPYSPPREVLLQVVLPLLAGLGLGLLTRSLLVGVATVAIVASLAGRLVRRVDPPASRVDREEAAAVARVVDFLARNRDWSLRRYRTPAGMRLIATHQRFDPQEPVVAEFFAAIGADPIYVRMCRNQRCFRARLSAKPWRIGIVARIGPRPGVWPVATDQLDRRRRWVQDYEQRAQPYAACRYVGTLGKDAVTAELREIVERHDRDCRSLSTELPLA